MKIYILNKSSKKIIGLILIILGVISCINKSYSQTSDIKIYELKGSIPFDRKSNRCSNDTLWLFPDSTFKFIRYQIKLNPYCDSTMGNYSYSDGTLILNSFEKCRRKLTVIERYSPFRNRIKYINLFEMNLILTEFDFNHEAYSDSIFFYDIGKNNEFIWINEKKSKYKNVKGFRVYGNFEYVGEYILQNPKSNIIEIIIDRNDAVHYFSLFQEKLIRNGNDFIYKPDQNQYLFKRVYP
jgi:hypothetical protein